MARKVKRLHLIFWWASQTPSAAVFVDKRIADIAGSARNALQITISGKFQIEEMKDWFRRDENGVPLPVKWEEWIPGSISKEASSLDGT